MKKIIFAIASLAIGHLPNTINAQSYKNTLKLGIMGGISVPENNASGNIGLDFSYQHLITGNIGIGFATGYNQFFAKEYKLIKNNDFGIIPIAGIVRYYPKAEGIYFGSDFGFGVITGDDKVAQNYDVKMPDGGFYIKPEIGYHNQKWNVFLHYTKLFTGNDGKINGQEFNAGSFGLGVSYNIPLGL